MRTFSKGEIRIQVMTVTIVMERRYEYNGIDITDGES